MSEAAPSPGAFAPLRNTLFRVLWVATVLGNVGTFMRDVASQWLVMSISPSAGSVALIQAAGTLPIFLFAIPAGVLSDMLDRRRFLIGVQVYLALVSTALALLAATGEATLASLVLLTFLGGTGAALAMPTWQAIVPELVGRAELRSAVALNSLGFNIARSLGPAIGGLVLAIAGASVTYGVDVLTYACVVAALLWWRRSADDPGALRENFAGALRAGLRYAFASPEMHRVLWRAVAFFLFASAIWALLPLVARSGLGAGPGLYGILLGTAGVGAILGALILPRARARVGQDRLVLFASLATAGATAVLGLTGATAVALAAVLVLGVAWIAVLVTLNATMQAVLPNWVRGRGLAIYLMAFNGAMAAGSLAWGFLADAAGISATLLASAGGLLVVALLAHLARLPGGGEDLSPSMHWPEVTLNVGLDRGPIIVTVTYVVAEDDRRAFVAVARTLRSQRLRDGAMSWGLAEDAADPAQIVEWFFVPSWAEHMRQHHRVSKAAADVQAVVRVFHKGPAAPEVRHLIGIEAASGKRPPSDPGAAGSVEHQAG